MINHPIPPVFNAQSRILILGSFPSVLSRKQGFFYGHPQNRFWRVTAAVLNVPVPQSIEEKKEFLWANGIALWDVIASCDIEGSADSSIKNVRPNDLRVILDHCDIRQIFVNGKTAEKLYCKQILPVLHREARVLPSTSPANASWNIERLCAAWRVIRVY